MVKELSNWLKVYISKFSNSDHRYCQPPMIQTAKNSFIVLLQLMVVLSPSTTVTFTGSEIKIIPAWLPNEKTGQNVSQVMNSFLNRARQKVFEGKSGLPKTLKSKRNLTISVRCNCRLLIFSSSILSSVTVTRTVDPPQLGLLTVHNVLLISRCESTACLWKI